jgi:hypothetical protein
MMIDMLVFYEIRAFQRSYIDVLEPLFRPDSIPISVPLISIPEHAFPGRHIPLPKLVWRDIQLTDWLTF